MNREFHDLAGFIEGFDFRFAANQAAGYEAFRRIILEHESFHEMRKYAVDEVGAQEIVERIRKLLLLEPDLHYENPYDAAIAAYLLALRESEVARACQDTDEIVEKPSFWWARKVAIRVVKSNESIGAPDVQ